jgi:hypothetical protein
MALENPVAFRDNWQRGQVCLGTCIAFSDPIVTEALAAAVDFVWIDQEPQPVAAERCRGTCWRRR